MFTYFFSIFFDQCIETSFVLLVTRERHLDWLKKQSSRTVYECAVIGAKGCGKTAFCRAMLGHSLLAVSWVLLFCLSIPICCVNSPG